MVNTPLVCYTQKLEEMEKRLEQLEGKILNFELNDILLTNLGEVGFLVNELLQYRITWRERQKANNLIKRVYYLQSLYLKTVINLQTIKLSSELKELVSDKAWHVFLRFDELREIEKELFMQDELHQDYYLDLVFSQRELKARLGDIKMKTSSS